MQFATSNYFCIQIFKEKILKPFMYFLYKTKNFAAKFQRWSLVYKIKKNCIYTKENLTEFFFEYLGILLKH